MNRSGLSRPANFARQGVLILLPVVLLAAIGLLSLRQDKLLVEGEAAERARIFADEFAEALWGELSSGNDDGTPAFSVDNGGRLIEPPPAPLVPTPQPYDLSAINPEQLNQWRDLMAEPSKTSDRSDVSNRMAAARAFLAGEPPERLAARAQLHLALHLARLDDTAAARDALMQVARQFPKVTGESGLPLAPLAWLKSLELFPDRSSGRQSEVQRLAQLVVTNPSPVTPMILSRLAALPDTAEALVAWDQQWQRDNVGRELLTAARLRAKPPWPRFFWFTNTVPAGATNLSPLKFSNAALFQTTNHSQVDNSFTSVPLVFEERWLAARVEVGTNVTRFVCRNQLNERLAEVVASAGEDSATVVATRRAVLTGPANLSQQLAFSATPTPNPFRASGKLISRLPGYLGISVDVAGHPLISSNHLPVIGLVGGAGKGAGQHYVLQHPEKAPALLASARKFDDGVEYLRVGVHLVSPDLLYSRQKTRIALFGLLIVSSAIAAVVGFISARRAFLRQQTLSDMKSNFVSSVSHELRAPIASVRLMAESLERGTVQDPARQGEYFHFIVQECRRLSSLIERVLDFARIEQGRKRYDFEPTDVATLVRETANLMQPVAREKQITLATGLSDSDLSKLESPPVLDGQAIQQALVNLIDNALKHSPAGSTVNVALTIAEPKTPNSKPETFSLSVLDRGSGIPPEEHQRIFERFYRRGSELQRETQGVGIGLSIVKHIVESHGGRILVESEVGQGSRFTIELPWEARGSKSEPRTKAK
jgi:signal transduction histidine kinase